MNRRKFISLSCRCLLVLVMFFLFIRLPRAHAQNMAGKLRTATAQATKNTALQAMKNQSLTFIENKGQWNPEARYLTRTNGANVWITNTSIVYDFYRLEHCEANDALPKSSRLEEPFSYRKPHPELDTTSRRLEHVVKMSFVGASPEARAVANNKQAGYYNYFIGNDQTAWATEVPLYGEVGIENLYQGVSARLYEENGSVRYDLIADAGADVDQIALAFEGAESARVNQNGDLALQTSLGEVTHGKLFVYQFKNGKRKRIDCRFVMKEAHHVSFALGEYDHSLPLVIDPLVYSATWGGSKDEQPIDIVVDASGAAYITGYTRSTNFPTTTGAIQTTYGGGDYDAFVTKINASGTAIIYSTMLGGNKIDWPNGIGIDATGAAYLAGSTTSENFPITSRAWRKTFGGIHDIFVAKLSATGSVLNYSTFLGFANGFPFFADEYAIAVDSSGAAYIAGSTYSSGHPTTVGVFQAVYGEKTDGFVTKLSPSGESLVYSTFLGGSDRDEIKDIVVDASGAVYVIGITQSTNFPTTPNTFRPMRGDGSFESFVTKLNSAGSVLVYSTFLGRSSVDIGNVIAVDASGAAYIAGSSLNRNGAPDVFVTKLSTTGKTREYFTLLEGNNAEEVHGIAVDATGSAHVAGGTMSTNFPTTLGAFQVNYGGAQDAFLTKLNTLGVVGYSTFLGSNDNDIAYSMALDQMGVVYVTGYTRSVNFPKTTGAIQTSSIGDFHDAFLTKLAPLPVLPPLWSSTSSINFGSVQVNTASTTQSYTLIGTNLTANVRVTASNGFEIATSPQDNFGSVLVFSPSNGSLTETIYVRFSPTGAGRAGGSITQTSGEAYFSVAVLGIATNPVSVRSSNPQASSLRIAVAPHPITDQTRLTLELRKAASVEVNIFDALGRLVQQRLLGEFAEGIHEIEQTMDALPTGTFTLVVRAGTEQATKIIQHIR